MTVLSDYRPTVAEVNGFWAYPFTMENIGLEVIEVYEVDIVAETRKLVPIQNYRITFEGEAPIWTNGVVWFTVPHAANITHIRIERNTPITQVVDFRRVEHFHPETLEFTFDKAIMICQEISARKCNDADGVPQTTIISQPINFYSGGPFHDHIIEAAMENLVTIIQEIEAAKEECLSALEET